ncbi:MAG: hypothetical protein EPN22_17020 [Nitrospirae bacterium]|nr:MAG: hypothetical protein EPN22_17020 [Nitrospirota bacterium]
MDVFPSITFKYDIETKAVWRTLLTEFETGKEQARKTRTFPLRTLNLPSGSLHETKIKDLWQFYQKQSGAYGSFWFVFPEMRHWYKEYIGRGDASQTTFDIPSIGTDPDQLVVYVDNVETSVTFISGGGQASSDRILFAAPPALGAMLTSDVYGKLRIPARFEKDELTDKLFHFMLYTVGIGIKEKRL